MLVFLSLMYKTLSYLRCAHKFSWPQTGADGRDYQVCVRCGARYLYDWQSMRQTRRVTINPEVAGTHLRSS